MRAAWAVCPGSPGLGETMMAMMAAKKRERMRLLKEQAEKHEKKAQAHFAEFANEAGLLDKAGLKLLLARLNPDAPPSDDGVNYVHHGIFPDDPHDAPTGLLAPAHMMKMNKLYHYWCAKEDAIDALFAKHDTDGSGLLDRDQMKAALVEIEKNNADKRAYDAGDWTTTTVELTEEFLATITANADWNQNGQLSKAEALAAMTLWSALAREEAKKKSAACVVA